MPAADRPPSHASVPRTALVIAGLGVFFAALVIAQGLLRIHVLRTPQRLSDLVVESTTRWLLYAAFAPIVGALVARFPIERGHRASRWPLHVVSTLALALGHSVAVGVIYRLFHVYPRQDSLLEAMGRLAMTYFAVNVLVFAAISGVFHAIRYHREITRREQLTAELRTRLVEARLEALRGQLDPHFLFNTLNAVSSLALTGERDAVIRVLSRLSDLLRVSLDPELPQEIPIELELTLLEGYLDIQRTRFGGRLTVEMQVAPETLASLLPTLALQTLVENALRHGIEARPGPGRVSITVTREASSVVLQVEDSGPGFATESSASRNGIGLANTRARLEQLYGARQNLELGNRAEGGAFVRMVLPYHTTPAAMDGGEQERAATATDPALEPRRDMADRS